MQEHHAAILERGAQIVAIGQGTGEEASGFCRQLKTAYPCLGNPGKEAYRAFGLSRGDWWSVGFKPFLDQPGLALRRIRRASLKGSMMKHTDVLQLGGVAIVDGQGVLRYLYRSQRPDDLPPTPDVIAELDRLDRPAGP